MRGETGFDLLQQFNNPSFKVIFVTGHNQYALNAIKFSALDYLLKPINDVELVNAVQKAKLQLDYEHRVDNLMNLFDTLKNATTTTIPAAIRPMLPQLTMLTIFPP